MLTRFKNLLKRASGKEVADTLEALGYFIYAHPTKVASLKKEISTAYDEYGMLSSIYYYDKGKHYPKDFRLYSLDSEALYQKDGFCKYLSEIQPTFKKLHIPFVIDKNKEEYAQDKGYTHNISVNGIPYSIFHNFRNYSRGSSFAAKKFIETVNDVLQRQNSDERVYPISRGLDGQLIFLTQKQYSYISAVYPDNESKPLKVKAWSRKYDVR